MKKQLCVIMLFASTFLCADFERGRELGQDIIDAPVTTAGGLFQGALGVISGAAEETGEILTGEREDRRTQREERQPKKIRKINGTYRQIK